VVFNINLRAANDGKRLAANAKSRIASRTTFLSLNLFIIKSA
jgi:hypothetical protein